MGALVGGIYATHKLEVYAQWALERMHVLRLLDPPIGRSAPIKGERIDLIGDCDIEELPISFTAVVTDLDLRHEVWMHKWTSPVSSLR